MKVTMAVNDDNGNHSGMVHMLDYQFDGDFGLMLECEDGVPCTVDREKKLLMIDGHLYPFLSYGTWAGNMALDCAGLSEDTALRLAEDCRASKSWSCVQAYTFIFDRWENGDQLTFDDPDIFKKANDPGTAPAPPENLEIGS